MATTKPQSRRGHESTLIGNLIYLFGGWDGKSKFPRSKIHVLDIQQQTWNLRIAGGPDIPPPCTDARCVVMDGLIYSYGGFSEREYLSDVYCLDPKKMRWELVETKQGLKPERRCYHCLCAMGSRMIMFGGIPWDDKVYEMKLDGKKKGSWVEIKTTGKGPERRYGAAMVEIDDSRALIHGGSNVLKSLNDFLVIDLHKKEWSGIVFNLQPSARLNHTLCRLKNKRLGKRICFFLVGGGLLGDHAFVLDFNRQKAFKMASVGRIAFHTAHSAEISNATTRIFILQGLDSDNLLKCLNFGQENDVYMAIESEMLADADEMTMSLSDRQSSQNDFESEEYIKSSADQLIYEKALKSGAIAVERLRLMFVGQDGSGKTSLIRSLLGKQFDKDVSSTDGVAIDVAVTDAEKWQDQKDGEKSFLDECLKRGFHLVRTSQESLPSTPPKCSDESVQVVSQSEPATKEGDRSAEIAGADYAFEGQGSQNEETDELLPKLPKLSPEFEVLLEISQREMGSLDQYIRAAEEQLSQKDNLQIVHLWDLGGQETYLSTHCSLLPSCLSRNSLTGYVVTVNLALPLGDRAKSAFRLQDGTSTDCAEDLGWIENNEDFVRAWLSNFSTAYPDQLSLQSHLGQTEDVANPPVFLAGTHIDLQAAKDILEQQNLCVAKLVEARHYENHIVDPPDDQRKLQSDYFFLIDNTKSSNCCGVKDLRKCVDQMRASYYSNRRPQPFRWILLEFLIARLKKSKPIIERAVLIELAIRLCNLSDKDEVYLALNHLDSLGIVVLFPGVPRLADEVFLDSKWLVKMLAVFVTAKRPSPRFMTAWRNVQKTGRMSKDLVMARMEDGGVPEGKSDVVLALLQQLDISCQVPSDTNQAADGESTTEPGDLFVPCLLTSKLSESTTTLWKNLDPLDPFPPPLAVVPQNVDAVPETIFFRLVIRFLRSYKIPPEGLTRHRCLFTTSSFDFELLYNGRGKAVTLSVGGEPSDLKGASWISQIKKLRQFFEKQVDEVRRPGMSGFKYEIRYCLPKPGGAVECSVEKTSFYKLYTDDVGGQWFQNASGGRPLKEWAEKGLLWRGCPVGGIPTSSVVDDALIRSLAGVANCKWEEIAIQLGFQTSYTGEMTLNHSSNFVRLVKVLEDWRLKEDYPTCEKLSIACGKAGISWEAIMREYEKNV